MSTLDPEAAPPVTVDDLLPFASEDEARPDVRAEIARIEEAIGTLAAEAGNAAFASPQADQLWLRISAGEEALAALHPAISYEGEGARQRAVFAALVAVEPLRAFALIARYRADATTSLRDELTVYEQQAEALYLAIRQGGMVSFVSTREIA